MLTDSDLAAMRADVAQLLPGSVVLYAPTYTNDGAGGHTLTYTSVQGTVAARLDPFLKRDVAEQIAAREGLLVEYVLTVPYNAPIAADYRAVYSDSQGQAGTFDIVGLAKSHSWNVSRRAYVAEVD